MTLVVFALALAAGGALALRPWIRAPEPWPADPPDVRDEVARAASSLRDLDEQRAAGMLDAAEHARLRALVEEDAARSPRGSAVMRGRGAPVRTLALAGLIAGILVAAAVATLPREAGDRAPGTTITGTVPAGAPSTTDLEARVARSPGDVPTLLALAESYRDAGRASDSASTYRRVLELDRDNVAALNGLALLLYQAGERDGAMLAVDRVLALRPRDADALFLRGLYAYQRGDFRGATSAWAIFLDIGEFHPAAPMVRPLYEDARRKLGD
ncbi:MAG TPA: tetratricopeptide repeat protein [Candidatus Limnocylindria bacterium]|nr:tetratricopeptide repeat protein [Candidatus Limnocylindria bacterium]